MIKIILFSVIFIFFSNPSFSIELKGSFEQGSLIVGKTNTTNEIFIDKKKNQSIKRWVFYFWNFKRQVGRYTNKNKK